MRRNVRGIDYSQKLVGKTQAARSILFLIRQFYSRSIWKVNVKLVRGWRYTCTRSCSQMPLTLVIFYMHSSASCFSFSELKLTSRGCNQSNWKLSVFRSRNTRRESKWWKKRNRASKFNNERFFKLLFNYTISLWYALRKEWYEKKNH